MLAIHSLCSSWEFLFAGFYTICLYVSFFIYGREPASWGCVLRN